MRTLPFLTILAVAGVAVAAPTPGVGPAVPPRSAAGRLQAIDYAQARLDTLVVASKRDRADLTIDVFNHYTPEQLEDPKRGITIDLLFEIVKNDAIAKEVRQRAVEAIVAGRVQTKDPALSIDGRGLKRKRAEFCVKVNKLLVDNELMSRVFAKQILESLWPGQQIRKEIKACEPRDKGSCQDANKMWDRILKGI
jgi:hypothetical protein